ATEESVIEARHHSLDNPGGLDRLNLLANTQELAERASFDEVHHDVMGVAFRDDFVDLDNVRMLERAAKLTLAAKGRRFFRLALSQHFYGVLLVSLPMG